MTRNEGTRIEVRNLTKRFGSFTAVDDLSFAVEPGRITGFLGPNGAGKTTTLRMLLGLVRPTSGIATIGGQPYREIRTPQRVVGAALEATNFHPGRSGRDHLRVLADTAGIDSKRVDEVLEMVGIPAAARQRAGGYSMGMRQRLGLAAAMLADPQVLLLDEPANGLDPEGIRWLRLFLRHLSSEGKTILISSHMLSEVEQTVDDVVIIANGRFIQQGSVATCTATSASIVRTNDAHRLVRALIAAGVQAHATDATTLEAIGEDMARVGRHRPGRRSADPRATSPPDRPGGAVFPSSPSPENRNRNLAAGAGTPDQDTPAATPVAAYEVARL